MQCKKDLSVTVPLKTDFRFFVFHGQRRILCSLPRGALPETTKQCIQYNAFNPMHTMQYISYN